MNGASLFTLIRASASSARKSQNCSLLIVGNRIMCPAVRTAELPEKVSPSQSCLEIAWLVSLLLKNCKHDMLSLRLFNSICSAACTFTGGRVGGGGRPNWSWSSNSPSSAWPAGLVADRQGIFSYQCRSYSHMAFTTSFSNDPG